MNDEFLKQYRKSPRPEFAEDLYKRISKPMNMQRSILAPRRLALAVTTLMAVFVVILVFSPSAKAFANTIFRKIGAIVLIDQSATNPSGLLTSPEPTSPPPTVGPTYYAHSDSEIGDFAGFQPSTPTYLPKGYLAQGPWSIVQLDESVGVYREYRDASGEHFLIFNPVKHNESAYFEQGYGDNEKVTDVTVRGQPGAWITGRLFEVSSGKLIPTNWLMWAENDVNYTMYSDGLPLDEMVKVAKSLK